MHFRRITLCILVAALAMSCKTIPEKNPVRQVWSKEQATNWGKQLEWQRGCNFIPSTAINQLEMWQAETFDTTTISRELGWAANIGMNTMRVYLHHLAWEKDSTGFKNRMKTYLDISSRKGISTIFVIFDDCWNPTYKDGTQPLPKPGIHNSGWVQDPGELIYTDSAKLYPVLERYVKDILTSFAADKRILLWDVYNEPGNNMPGLEPRGNKSLTLLAKVFGWGREVNPSQPLSSAVWNGDLKGLNKFQLANSDVITYHNYSNETDHQKCIDTLRVYGKPLLCTEYMARTNNSRFENIMPLLKKENIAAINWGLVSGKTNTKYAWATPIPDGSEPKLWFHDIFREDGTPYLEEETTLIKQLTQK